MTTSTPASSPKAMIAQVCKPGPSNTPTKRTGSMLQTTIMPHGLPRLNRPQPDQSSSHSGSTPMKSTPGSKNRKDCTLLSIADTPMSGMPTSRELSPFTSKSSKRTTTWPQDLKESMLRLRSNSTQLSTTSARGSKTASVLTRSRLLPRLSATAPKAARCTLVPSSPPLL